MFSKSYPFGAADLQPLIREVMATNPDAFIAFSYPPDTFMLTEQCQIVGFNPQIMYVAIGGVFPTYKGKFGNKVNGILAYGGVDPNAPGMDEYDKAHQAMFNRDSEAGAVSVYAALQVMQQAIETVGEIDRKKIRDAIASGTFKTVWGDLELREPAQRQSLGGRPVAERRDRRVSPDQQGRRQAAAVPEARVVVTYQRCLDEMPGQAEQLGLTRSFVVRGAA